MVFDYAVSKWKEEQCKCKNARTPGGPAVNAGVGAANGAVGPFATKPRTGVGGGGPAGSTTSPYSQAVSKAYEKKVIGVATMGTLRRFGRVLSKAEIGRAHV